eukprot:scaffold81376_cov57-Phaeocystis_antarctica.AAC.2
MPAPCIRCSYKPPDLSTAYRALPSRSAQGRTAQPTRAASRPPFLTRANPPAHAAARGAPGRGWAGGATGGEPADR